MRKKRSNFDKSQRTEKKFDTLENPDSDTKNQMVEISFESFSLTVRLLILTIMKEVKPVVTEKRHLDNQNQSILATTFYKFRTIRT